MRLGIGVYLVPFEHPILLAETFATLDQLSGGRVVLGVGAGYRDDEFDSFGVDRTTRGPRLVETLELVEKLWTGERVTHHGRFFDVEDQAISVVPAQRPRPPIWVGASEEKTIRRAAHIGDAWLASPNVKPKFAIGNLQMFQQELEDKGIDPAGREYPLLRELYIADTDAAAYAEAEKYIRGEYLAFAEFDPVYEQHYEDMARKSFLFGSPDTVAERIAELAAGGFNHLIFRTNWPGMPAEMARSTVERFAAEVMPRFAAGAVMGAAPVHHASITVTDLDRSIEFYERVLGLRTTMRAPLDERTSRSYLHLPPGTTGEMAMLQASSHPVGALELIAFDGAPAPRAMPLRPGEPGVWMVAFEVVGET